MGGGVNKERVDREVYWKGVHKEIRERELGEKVYKEIREEIDREVGDESSRKYKDLCIIVCRWDSGYWNVKGIVCYVDSIEVMN